jgi:hypothetical protein
VTYLVAYENFDERGPLPRATGHFLGARCRPTIAYHPLATPSQTLNKFVSFANLPLLHKMGDEQHVDRVSVFLGYAELVNVFDDGGLVAVNNSVQYKLQVDTEL